MRLLKVLNAVLIRKLIGKLMARVERDIIFIEALRDTLRPPATDSQVSSPESFGLLINRDLIKLNRKETRDTDVRECLEQIYCFLQPHNKWVSGRVYVVCVRFVCEPESLWVLWHCETSHKPQSGKTRLRRRLAESPNPMKGSKHKARTGKLMRHQRGAVRFGAVRCSLSVLN